ncbi:MAG: sulfotransferase [Acidobacteriota bacterium]
MMLPNFLVIGTARAGTTALTAFLSRHPEVFIPLKEPNYFSGWLSRKSFEGPQDRNVKPEYRCGTIEQYSRLFEGSEGFQARGEASVSYLPDTDAPALIRKTIPDVRLIAILRQPAERAFAHFHLQRLNRLEPVADFLQALEEEQKGLRRNWLPSLRYVEWGLYSVQLRRYRALFSTEQLKVFLADDWRGRPDWVWRQILETLGIDNGFTPDFSERYGATCIESLTWRILLRTRSIWPVVPTKIRRTLGATIRSRCLKSASVSRELREELTERYFRDDVLRLQDLLGCDLKQWFS